MFYTAACAFCKIISEIARKSSFPPSQFRLPFWRRRKTTSNDKERGRGRGSHPAPHLQPKESCKRGHARMIQNINIARFPHNSRVAERVTHARRRPKGPWRPRMSGISPDRGKRKRERRWKEEDAGRPAVCVFVLLKAQGPPLSERPIVGYELPRKTRSLRWKNLRSLFSFRLSLSPFRRSHYVLT